MTARNGAAPLRRLAQAACVLLALAGLAPASAQAQVEDYISNLRSALGASSVSGNEITTSRRFSQEFRTGSRSGGYPLSEVVLHLSDIGTGAIEVTIRENSVDASNRNVPGTTRYTLTNPSSLSSGRNTFTAPSNATLEADTAYHIVAESTSGSAARWRRLSRSSATIDNAGGWDIDFDYLRKSGPAAWGAASPSRALAVAVRGELPAPPPPPEDILVGNTGKKNNPTAVRHSRFFKAQSFTTGDAPGGYDLSSVVLEIKNPFELISQGAVEVTIRESDGDGAPVSTNLYTLGRSASEVSEGVYEWQAPAGATLEAGTEYHVMARDFSSVGNFRAWRATTQGGTDPGAASGWSIGGLHTSSGGSFWNPEYPGSFYKFQIRGTETEVLPVVTIERVSPVQVTEGTNLTFRVTREGDTSQSLTVNYRVNEGPALAGETPGDMVASGDQGDKTLVFSPGDTEKTVTVPTVDDSLDEQRSRVIVTLQASASYEVGDPDSTFANVNDNDEPNTPATGELTIDDTAPRVGDTLTADASQISDADGPASPTFAWRWIRVSGGTETPIPGATSASYTVVAADLGATLKVEASFTDDGGTDEAVESAETAAVGKALPTVTVTPVTTPVTEGSDAVFRLARTGDTAARLQLFFSISETGDMCRGSCAGSPASATIPAGLASTNLFVLTSDDSAHEADSVVTVTLAANAAYELGTDTTAEVTVEDNDNAAPTGTVTIDDTTPMVGETLTADASGVSDPDGPASLTFTWRWLRVSGGTATPIPGATAAAYTVVAADAGATLKAEASFTDDDGTAETVESAETDPVGGAPLPALSIGDASAAEGDSGSATLEFTVTLDSAATATVTVDWATSDGTATAGTDYTAGNGTLTFGAGDSSRTVSVTVAGDEADEPDETFEVTLTNPSGATLGDATATGTITNDDDDPTVTLVLTPDTITEDGGASALSATLDHASGRDTVVTVSVSPVGPATASDYSLSPNVETLELVVPAGDTESDGTVTITAVDNNVDAPHKTVTVSATAANDAGVTAPQDVTLTITDDENTAPTGAVTIDDTTPMVGEILTADASGVSDPDGPASLTFTWQWIRVASGGTRTRIAGATTASYTVVDADVGSTLKVEAAFTDDGGTSETVESAATATVEAVSLPTVTVAPVASSVVEGEDAQFTVTRTGVTTGALTVHYNVVETGAMVRSSDKGAQTVDFSGNTASVTVTVPTVFDNLHEQNSRVTVTLTADAAYELGTATARVLVKDDDDSPATGTVTVTGTAREGETLTADTSGITDEDGGLDSAAYVYQWVRTPSGGSDADISGATSRTYVPVYADAGATLKVKVTVTDGEGHEGTFTSAPTSAVTALPRPEVTVASDGDVTEGSAAVFTVTRTGDTARTLDVDYEVTASGDFGVTAFEATLAFLANSAAVQLSVPTTGDGTHEAHGSVTLALTADTSAAPAYLLGDPATATAAVEDDDDSPTTGAVTVTGTAREGETLTADTSGLADGDGLDSAAHAWQWVRTPSGGGDADIPGATSRTYVPVFADAGATLKVRVTVTDDEGHEATFASVPTAAVAALPRPEVTVASDGDVTEGGTAAFTLTRTGATTKKLGVAYEVTATGAFGAATGAGTATFPANGATVRVSVATTGDGAHEAHGSVTVALTADTGADPAYLLGDPAAATAAVRDDDNVAPTGAPTIDDTTPVVGQTLTADASGIGDADGTAGATFAWRWLRVATGGGETEVGTGATYAVVAGDAGSTLKVEARFTDDGGTGETVESAETSAVEAAPRPRVSVARVASTVEEGAGARFTVTRTGVTTGTLTVRYDVSESGAMVASGEEGAKSVTFADGDTERTVTVPTVEDNAHEADSTVTLTLTANADYDLGTATADVTVEDDDNAAPTGAPAIDDTTPVVGETLTADPSNLDDPDGLTSPTYAWRWLRVASGGGETQVGTGTTYTVVAGDAGSTLKVEAAFTDDDGTAETVESSETATVEAAPVPTVSVARVASPVSEGAGAQFTVTRTGVTTGALTVRYDVSESGAMVASGDEGAQSVDFPGNAASVTVTVPTADDSAHEADSVVTVALTADAAYDLGTDTTATVTVEDNDNAAPTGAPTIDDTTPVVGETLTADASGIADPDGLTSPAYAWRWLRVAPGGGETQVGTGTSYTVVAGDVGATLKAEAAFTDDDGTRETVGSAATATVEAAPVPTVSVARVTGPVKEGADARFTVTRTGVTTGALTVRYDVSETGAMVAPGEEGARTVAFGDGDTERTVTVPTADDSAHEADSVVTVALTADAAYDLGTDTTATVTVEDDDNATPTGAPTIDDTTPVVGETLTADPSGIGDPDGLTGPTYAWRWIRTSGGTDTPIGGATAATYTVVAGDVGATLKAEASFTDDDGTRETVESAATATVAAAARPRVSVARVAGPVEEGEDARFRVTRTGVTAGALTVRYDVSESGAMVASGEEGGRIVAFGDGDTGKTVSVPTVEDTVHEADSVVTVALTADAAYDLGTAAATVAVEDDDNAAPTGAPTIDDTTPVVGQTLTADASNLDDPDGLTGASLSWQWIRTSGGRDTRIGGATAATYTVADADAGATLKVAASFTDDDGTRETVESAATATVAPRPTVTLVLTPDSVTEAGGESVVTARLDRASGADTTVTVSAAPVAPATEADYRLGANRVLTIPAGGTESVGRVTVTAVNNAVDAPDRTVTVTGKAANRQGLAGDPEPVTLTIRDNDAAPTVTLHLSRPAIVEDGGTTAVTARLSHPSSADTTVTVEVASAATAERLSVAATAELPYVLSDNRELRIPAGGTESVGLVTITAVDNDAEAPDRTVTVTATAANAQGVAVPQAPGAPALAATLTIADDEGRELSIGNARAAEGSGAALRFAVTLEPPAAAEVTVDWTVVDGTARAGKDHGAGSGTLTFGAGESAGTVTVAVTDDDADEPDETVTVVLSNPSGATVARAEGTGTIADDDAAPAVSLRLTPDTIAENGGTATVTARLDRPSSERTTVTVSAAPVAPATAADYRLGANRVLTIAAGERESAGVVTIAAVDNDAEAPDRTVTVSGKATNRQGLAGDPEPVTLTIADDELVEERRRRLGYALAAFGRAVARDLVAAVGDRPRSARAGTTATLGGTPLVSLRSGEGVHGALRRHLGPDGDLPDGAEWRELLSRSSFQLSLGGEGEAGGAGVPVLWGRGSLSRSAGRLDPEVTTRGETLSGQLGLELRVREDTLLGVMLSGSSGEVEFDGERDADVETELVGVHPYARWSPRRGLRTWAMLGYGTGEAVLRDGFSTRTGAGVGTDIEMTMAAGGGSHEVASLWGVDWSVGTSGFLVQLDADGQAELLPALESGVWQARLLLEGSAGEGFGGVAGLRGNVELAARVDGGDAESGMGMELGGGVGYGHADLGLEVEASGRVLLSHEEEGLEDAGVSLGLEFDPGASGRGLYFALTPSWGNAASGARSVWEGRRTTAGGSGERDPSDPEMRLSSEFGHAAPALAGRGTLTTYGAFSSDGDATHRYRVGRRLELDVLSMSLEAELRESADAAPGHGVRLTGSIRF